MAAAFDLADPGDACMSFLTDRHLATLTTIGQSGVQVTPVGFTYEPARALARVITWSTSQKALNVAHVPGQRVALCQVDGGRWLTLYGAATVADDPESITEGVQRYAARYRAPKERSDRVVIEIAVDRLIGRA